MAKCIFGDFCITCGSCAFHAPHVIKGKECEDPICLYGNNHIPENYLTELQKAVEECPTENISIGE